MQVINWLALQPPPADLDALREHLQSALPLRKVCQLLVEITLRAYPWTGRADLISCYHPSLTYKQGERIALLIADPQNVRPTVWQFAQVKHTKVVENPVQGRFQVWTMEIHGRQLQLAGGIPDASYPHLDLSSYSSKDLAWLVNWLAETYAVPLQASLEKLIQKRQIGGGPAGEIFLPDQVSALSPELLHPLFARITSTRPWITLEEIYKSLPELSSLKRETVLALLHAALQESPYPSLGAGRWTTPELFHQINREVPQGLPKLPIRSKAPLWTKRDEKDLAGYDKKFVRTDARQALEELGVVEKSPEPQEVPWRPPKDALRLPPLNFLHITQAYFPVGDVLRAFAPEFRMVFVQFIKGDHQPFLLDKENGLLKAVHPEGLRDKILKEGLPAGTYLWIEYEGDEKYRIAPRPLPFKRMVPCKLAYLEDHRLQIEHTQISMMYEGRPSLFKANLLREEIEALFSEANRADLSVREAMIYAIQEICATDPDHRAQRLDIFNAVFLQRMCSPSSVSLLLYTQPCFEPLGSGYFRYKPIPDKPQRKKRSRKDRLSKLWDHLLSDAVAPNPAAEERTTIVGHLQDRHPVFPAFAADLELPSLLRGPETKPEVSLAALPLVAVEEDTSGQIVLQEEKRVETVLLSADEPEPFTTTDEQTSRPWRESIDKLLHSLVELTDDDPSSLSEAESGSEQDASPNESIESAHEESLSFSSPFRWEPKPAWIDVPGLPRQVEPEGVDARHLVYLPRVPIRPLHKQPFYRRIFFYLRGWLSRTFRKSV